MMKPNYLRKILDGVEVEWKSLDEVFDILAGGDVPKGALSDKKTEEFSIPILSNGKDERSLYGWTNKAKINNPSLTISARGTIGWTSYIDKPFFPIVRLLVLTPKIELNLKYAYHFMKMIENNYRTQKTGIPQLTKPMIKDIEIPIPCPGDIEKSLEIQKEIVLVLDTFTEHTAECTVELTAELTARKKQYNYYRDKVLSFEGVEVEWKKLDDLVKTITSPAKVKKEAYREEGKIPIVDQGKDYIAGYTDEDVKPVNADQYIIFGDHSEHIKYVDFSFIQGADGLKILKPKSDYAKYIYYAFENNYRKELRYKRHWSSAKETLIPIPCPDNLEKSLEIQKKIVRVLDNFTELSEELTSELRTEITGRHKQFEYYRNRLISFTRQEVKL